MKTIVWDVDDVLNGLMFSWLEEFQSIHCPSRHVKYQSLTKNPPHEILGITLDEYLVSLDRFRNSEKGRNLHPNNMVMNWFREHGESFRHIALTARPKNTVPVLAEWVFDHYGNWIRTVSFIPSNRKGERLPVYDEDKAHFLRWLEKADYYIDDSSENVRKAQAIGVSSFIFPQPWNSSKMTVLQILNHISDSKNQ